MIIYHHNDADGRAAAAIAVQWHEEHEPGTRCSGVELDYKQQDKIKPEEEVQPDEMVCILDFSFKQTMMERILAITKNVVWCDHHATAKEYPYSSDALLGVRDFEPKGLCGAECTWKYFYPNDRMPKFLEILGDYDSWRLKKEVECKAFYEGLKMEDTSIRGGIWFRLLANEAELYDKVRATGASVLLYRDNYCTDLRTMFGYETEIGGHKAFAMNVYKFGSAQFGPLFKEYPVCIAYIFDGAQFTVSLYSETVDVSAICKTFGGGGHPGAAGFVCTDLPFSKLKDFGDQA